MNEAILGCDMRWDDEWVSEAPACYEKCEACGHPVVDCTCSTKEAA